MAVKFWTGQSVTMSSALGGAQAITALSRAANGQVTTSGTLPANGAYVLLSVTGMRQVTNRVFKVSGATGTTFNLGIDTTAFDTFLAGSFQVITMDKAFDSVRDPQSSGGDPKFEDTTTVHDTDDVEAIVSGTAQGYNWTVDWNPTNAALLEANKAFVSRTPRAFRFGDPDGSEYLFWGFVAAPMNPTVSGKKKVTPIAVRLLATGTAY